MPEDAGDFGFWAKRFMLACGRSDVGEFNSSLEL